MQGSRSRPPREDAAGLHALMTMERDVGSACDQLSLEQRHMLGQILGISGQERQEMRDKLDRANALIQERDNQILELRNQLLERDRQLQQANLEQASFEDELLASIDTFRQAKRARLVGAGMDGRDEQHQLMLEQPQQPHAMAPSSPAGPLESIEEFEAGEGDEELEDVQDQQPQEQREATQEEPLAILYTWFDEHLDYSYPTPKEVEQLSQQTGWTAEQLKAWLYKARFAVCKFTVEQLELLQASYDRSNRLDWAQKAELARATGQSVERIKAWFVFARKRKRATMAQ